MFIKYKNNIHNICKYKSIIKSGELQILLANDNDDIKLLFENKAARDYILIKIWNELTINSNCYDIDDDIAKFYTEQKYNV